MLFDLLQPMLASYIVNDLIKNKLTIIQESRTIITRNPYFIDRCLDYQSIARRTLRLPESHPVYYVNLPSDPDIIDVNEYDRRRV